MMVAGQGIVPGRMVRHAALRSRTSGVAAMGSLSLHNGTRRETAVFGVIYY
jgi:hypothetical protein